MIYWWLSQHLFIDAAADTKILCSVGRYDEQMGEFLDQAYERLVARKESSAKKWKRARQTYTEKDNILEVWNYSQVVRVSKFSSLISL